MGADDGRRLGWLLGGMKSLGRIGSAGQLDHLVTLDGHETRRCLDPEDLPNLCLAALYSPCLLLCPQFHLLEAAISLSRAAATALIGRFRYSCLSPVLSSRPGARRKC